MLVTDLAADSGALCALSELTAESGRLEVLQLRFAHGTLEIGCDAETDEVVLLALAPDQPNSPSRSATTELKVLADLVGTRIEYLWEMRNHLGYCDAVQIRFIDPLRRTTTIQFECAAAELDVFRVIDAT